MKALYTLSLAVLAGAALGVVAVQGLRNRCDRHRHLPDLCRPQWGLGTVVRGPLPRP
jgi:hypothetical protein